MLKQASTFAALTIGSFAILLIYALVNLVDIQRELRRELGVSNLWVAVQTEREAQQVLITLANGFPHAADNDLQLRFELLYSRILTLADPVQLAHFRKFGQDTSVEKSLQLIQEMERLNVSDPAERHAFATKAAQIAMTMRELSVATNMFERDERVQRRDEQASAMRLLMVAVMAVFVIGTVMAGLLLRNMKGIRGAQRALEAHRTSLEDTIKTRTRDMSNALAVERRAKDIYRSFIITVSHQFRTPVSIIHMIAQRQMRNAAGELSETTRSKFSSIYEAAERLERLIGVFLDSASVDRADIRLTPKQAELNAIVAAAATQIGYAHPDRDLQLHLSPDPLPLRCDPLLIEQVLINLFSNAVKYSAPGTAIRVTTQADGANVHCSVSDLGVGIPLDAQPAIFDRFFRATNVHRLPGVGIGLSLAHDIVVLHGGQICFSSQEGEGSTFTVVLPEGGVEKNDRETARGDNPLCGG